MVPEPEPSSINEPSGLPLKDRPIGKRVELLLADFKAYDPKPLALCIDNTEITYPPPEGYTHKSPYIVVKAEIETEPGPSTVLITTPVNPDDENMRFRLTRSVVLRHALTESLRDEELAVLLDVFRFPQIIAVRNLVDSKSSREFAASIMEKYPDTKPVGSVHLVKPGVFTTDDMRHMAQLFRRVQKVGQPFTGGEDFRHFRISVPFSDRQNNKWWIDYKNNPARLEAYERVFGQEFVDRLGELLQSPETAAMFSDSAPRYLVLGNIIPVKMGKDADGKIVLRDIERTAYTQSRAFDYATFLVTLISDPARLQEFLEFAIEQNPDSKFLEHLRRSVLLDRLGNLPDLLRDLDAAKQAGDQGLCDFLNSAIANLKTLAEEALYQRGLWNPTQYNFA